MKKIKFMIMLALVAALPLFSSCNDNDFDSSEYPSYYGYVTLATDLTNNTYWFVSDAGKTIFPGEKKYFKYNDESSTESGRAYTLFAENDTDDKPTTEVKYPLTDSEGKDKNGRRVMIYYNILEEPMTGYDYNISLFRIYDILSKTVEVATTEEELNKFGEVGLNIAYANISGDWLDTQINVVTASGAKHTITLVDNQYEIKNTVSIPSDYIYLELHQSVTGNTAGSYATGNVSFKLPDLYHPKKQGKKGLCIGYKDLAGNYQVAKIAFK